MLTKMVSTLGKGIRMEENGIYKDIDIRFTVINGMSKMAFYESVADMILENFNVISMVLLTDDGFGRIVPIESSERTE